MNVPFMAAPMLESQLVERLAANSIEKEACHVVYLRMRRVG